jgi:hypothetical protein
VDDLPPGVDAADRERAEMHLVHLAGEHDAGSLRRLARRLHEVIDPDAADEAEARRLEGRGARGRPQDVPPAHRQR